MYRGFIKNIANLAGETIGSAELKIKDFTIRRDLLNSAQSEFELISIPTAVENGNIFGVYNDAGKTVYVGVIASIDNNVIRTGDILNIFDDLWLYRNPHASSIENTIKSIITTDFAQSRDSLLATIFSQFTINTSTTNDIDVGLESENYTVNFKDWLISLYNLYGLTVDINIPYNQSTPVMTIGIVEYPEMKIGDNTNVVRNFNVTSEVQETNKLVIYGTNGSYRASYYVTPSGITTDSTALDRIIKIKSKIVFSDLEDLSAVVAQNIEEISYNHKITLELLLGNTLLNFDNYNLGQYFTVYHLGNAYSTILTGYDISSDDNGKTDYVKLTFGKVRYSLDKKLQKQSQQIGQVINVSNSQKWIKQYFDEEIGEWGQTIGAIQVTTNENSSALNDLTKPTGTIATLQSQISQNAESINLKADSSTVETYKTNLDNSISQVKTDLSSSIEVQAGRVTTLSTSVENIDGAVTKLGSAFVVESDGAKVFSVNNNSVDENNYTQIKTDGMHIIVNQTEVAWNTADGSGTPQMTIAPDSTATQGWQFRMDSANRLNINWHS